MRKDLTNIEENIEKVFEGAQDFLPLLGTDYIEFYVGNAKQAAHFYKTAFGFQSLAYAGLETGWKDKVSYVLKQDKIRLVLTTALNSKSEIGNHVKKHGDGVKVIALWVEDSKKSYEETIKRGAKSYLKPVRENDEFGEVVKSGIYTYGETVHLFIERKITQENFFQDIKNGNLTITPLKQDLNILIIWLVMLDGGEMNTWVNWYEDVMGFVNFLSFDDKQIHTEYSALMSKVMSNGNGRIKFPINEPAKAKKKSQIEEYLDFYEGPGVQHIAIATDNIIQTVQELKKRGIEFLSAPPNEYYKDIPKKVGGSHESHERRY